MLNKTTLNSVAPISVTSPYCVTYGVPLHIYS